MATRYYIGAGDDWNDNTYWSTSSGGAGGASFPTASDDAIFDSNSGACTLDANAACLSLTLGTNGSAYNTKLDFGSSDMAIGTGGLDCTYANGGSAELDLGSGTTSCAGDWDSEDVDTFTRGTSTLQLTGSSKSWKFATGQDYNDVTVSGSYTVGVTYKLLDIYGDLNVSGTLTTATGSHVYIHGASKTVTVSGTIDGPATLAGSTSNDYIIAMQGGTLSTSVTVYQKLTLTTTGSVTFSGNWRLDAWWTVVELELASAQVYTFTGSFTLDAANPTSITIDNGHGGTLKLEGDVAIIAGTATITGDLPLTGTSNQDFDGGGATVAGDITVNKSAGNLVMTGNITTNSFTGTSTGTGDFDPNAQTITITGNCSWAAAFLFDSAADCMNGSIWDIGGDFAADGQTLNATARWDLQVDGAAVASGTGDVAHSNAAGYTEIDASAGPWTDSGNNDNWNFGVGAAAGRKTPWHLLAGAA